MMIVFWTWQDSCTYELTVVTTVVITGPLQAQTTLNPSIEEGYQQLVVTGRGEISL